MVWAKNKFDKIFGKKLNRIDEEIDWDEEDYDFDISFTPDEEIPDNVVPVEVFMTKQILKMLGDNDVR